jgi:glucose/arabinose dehydrogenase
MSRDVRRQRNPHVAVSLILGAALGATAPVAAQTPPPTVFDPNLAVRTVVDTGLELPIGVAFLGAGDYLVLEKASGKVKRIRTAAGQTTSTDVLDLAVNSFSERGLLSIALHPNFPANPGVYLFWTESSTGADSSVAAEVGNPASPYPPGTPNPFGSRVDRFVWNGSSLTFDANLLVLRSYQEDPLQPLRGNHNGGVIRFGVEGESPKLYVVLGDQGRRGQLQNLESGPPKIDQHPHHPFDDQFGGPEPDAAHLAGVVLRLNEDGSSPTDNPFHAYGASVIEAGQTSVGESLQKIYAYGIRNSFGMAIDPRTRQVWIQENGDDSFSELNRLVPGANGGWVKIMGPSSRVAEFKAIETGSAPLTPNKYAGMQQVRYPPSLLPNSPEEALASLFMLPGAVYNEPALSWRYEIAPGGIGFLASRALGPQYQDNLFMGAATPAMDGGYLFRFRLTGNRQKIAVDDPRLADGVADNLEKHSFLEPGASAPGTLGIVESESLRFGRDFGVATAIETGPNGNLYVVSLTRGAIYEVYRRGTP